MELNELKAIVAASIFAGYIASGRDELGAKEISESVVIAQDIWEEVLRQDRQ